jgi:hypothetical protein
VLVGYGLNIDASVPSRRAPAPCATLMCPLRQFRCPRCYNKRRNNRIIFQPVASSYHTVISSFESIESTQGVLFLASSPSLELLGAIASTHSPAMTSYHTLLEKPLNSLSNVFRNALIHSLGLQILPAHADQILITAIVYLGIKNLISPPVSSYLFPGSYPKFSRKSKVLWDVGAIQMIKAPLNCVLSLAVLMQTAHEPDINERVWSYSQPGASVQAIATGFYLFEILVSFQYFDVVGWPWLLHGIASTGCSLLGFRPTFNYYSCRFLLLELPVFFEIFENSLRKLRMTDMAIYRYNHATLLVLYSFAKVVWGPYQLCYAVLDAWTALRFGGSNGQELPLWVAASMMGSITLVMVLGLYGFQKVLQRDL